MLFSPSLRLCVASARVSNLKLIEDSDALHHPDLLVRRHLGSAGQVLRGRYRRQSGTPEGENTEEQAERVDPGKLAGG